MPYAERIDLRIDHHRNDGPFTTHEVVNPISAACGQIVHLILLEMGAQLDEPMAIRLFEAMAERKLPLLVHTGDTRYPYSEPERMARALDAVPELTAICAHLGGWSRWDKAWQLLAGRENVYVDCCSSLYALPPEEAAEVIYHYGADRVFFGTDYPMWTPKEEIARFMALPLTDAEREMILHENFERFIGERE